MLVKCGERVGTKVLKVLNMRMCKITDEVIKQLANHYLGGKLISAGSKNADVAIRRV